MSPQTFDTIDVARLEVRVPATGLTNLVANPDGKRGAWGWLTPVATSWLDGYGSLGLYFTSAVAVQPCWFTTEPMRIDSGQYAAASWLLKAVPTGGAYYRVRFEWLDATQAVLSSSTQTSYLNTVGNAALAAQLAPAGTKWMRLRFDLYGDNAGANPSGQQLNITNVVAAKAATAGALTSSRTNYIGNPSFEVDTVQWAAGSANSTIARSTAQAAVGSASLAMTGGVWSPSAVANIFTVTEGRDYTAQVKVRAATTGRLVALYLVYYDAANTPLLTAHNTATDTTGGWTQITCLGTAPPTSSYARLTVSVSGAANGEVHYLDAVAVTEGPDVPPYFDGATAAAGTLTYSWTGTAHNSASTQLDSTLTTLAPTEWRNILGTSHTIRIVREALNVGTLHAEVLDATLDPATSANLRPGCPVRLTALVGSTWEPVFTGTIDQSDVEYDVKSVPAPPPRVTMVAIDATKQLTGASRANGVAKIRELPAVLEGCGVPWLVNGYGGQLATTPAVVSVNENATALDQLALTRDSAMGYAWVDRTGVAVAHDTPPAVVLVNPTFDTNTTGWTAGASTTIARVTTPVHAGAGALSMTRTGTTGTAQASTASGLSGFPVVGGRPYRFGAWFRSAAVARNATVTMSFVDSAGGTLVSRSATTTTTTTGWTEVATTSVAPGEAVFATITVAVASVAVGELHYVDDVSAQPAGAVAVLDEGTYSDLAVGWSSTECINSLTVEHLALIDGKSVATTLGPYEDAASIDTWGPRPAKVTVHGIALADVATFAAAVLARNANPAVTVQSVALPLRSTAELTANVLRDLGELVQVINTAKALTPTLRIARVEHRIDTDKWMVDLGFAGASSVAAPTVAPAIADPVTFGDTSWAPLAFGSGFSDFGSGFETCQYRRKDGVVYLRGLGNSAARVAGSIIGILPPGFRPGPLTGSTAGSHITIPSNGAFAIINIRPLTGQIEWNAGPSAGWFSLANISHIAEQ